MRKADDLNVMDVCEGSVVEKLNGDSVECGEACWVTFGEPGDVCELKRLM